MDTVALDPKGADGRSQRIKRLEHLLSTFEPEREFAACQMDDQSVRRLAEVNHCARRFRHRNHEVESGPWNLDLLQHGFPMLGTGKVARKGDECGANRKVLEHSALLFLIA